MPTTPVHVNRHLISVLSLVIWLPWLSTVANATQIKCKRLGMTSIGLPVWKTFHNCHSDLNMALQSQWIHCKYVKSPLNQLLNEVPVQVYNGLEPICTRWRYPDKMQKAVVWLGIQPFHSFYSFSKLALQCLNNNLMCPISTWSAIDAVVVAREQDIGTRPIYVQQEVTTFCRESAKQ